MLERDAGVDGNAFVWRMVPLHVMWSLWEEQNYRALEGAGYEIWSFDEFILVVFNVPQ